MFSSTVQRKAVFPKLSWTIQLALLGFVHNPRLVLSYTLDNGALKKKLTKLTKHKIGNHRQ